MPSILTTSIALSLIACALGVETHTPLQPSKRSTRHQGLARSPPKAESKRAMNWGLDKAPVLGGFKMAGDSGVSAQMMFLGTENTVYILDKTENNSLTVTTPSGDVRPAWGTYFDLTTNLATPMSVESNTFCAGGISLGDGRWAVFGGNQPVTYHGIAIKDAADKSNPYGNAEGGDAIRVLKPCDDGTCVYDEGGADLTMTGKRWYPYIEALGDGSAIIIGGDTNGGYVSTQLQNNPTYEFYPKRGPAVKMDFLSTTVPLNLFALTWLMPSGKLFMQAAYSTIMYDLDTQTETKLPDMPYAVRVYPASAATAMLPLTPENNYTPTLLFCGGSNAPFNRSSDGGAGYNVTAIPADDTCVRITPESANPAYEDDDNLPEGRSMGNFIYLPDGTMWLGNGVAMGTAGYGDEGYSLGQSYGQDPIYMPAIYNPKAPLGSRFSRDGLTASGQERMYHSSAILLADGSVMVAGSNPNKDVTFGQWGTSYEVEKFYPTWYTKPRPEVTGWPSSLSYGGDYWNITYTPKDTSIDPSSVKVVLIRTGFSTHAINMGQRYLELATSYTKAEDTNELTVHVSQMPPNANIFQPGPAMIFLVENGVPSTGKLIMIGNGQIGTQPISQASVLPDSAVVVSGQTNANHTDSATAATAPSASTLSGSKNKNAATPAGRASWLAILPMTLGAFAFSLLF